MKNYIPTHKSDMQATSVLLARKEPLTYEDTMELLSGMADMNWEIAYPISEYFRKCVNEITSNLVFIFSDQDNEWKGNLIRFLLIDNENFIMIGELHVLIKRMAEHPTPDEKENDVDELCVELLNQHK
jgi:hypothetical protein